MAQSDDEGRWFLIYYQCPDCGNDWHEEWSCACDSECPHCGARNIQATSWEDTTKPV
jgi:predicted Zn-ribbon and HTH transcriptional regulator